VYGSPDESIAIWQFQRLRNSRYIESLLPVADPKELSKVVRNYRGYLFPEDRTNDLFYIKKARDVFKNIKGVSFTIKPI
jgi:hypothetical protein